MLSFIGLIGNAAAPAVQAYSGEYAVLEEVGSAEEWIDTAATETDGTDEKDFEFDPQPAEKMTSEEASAKAYAWEFEPDVSFIPEGFQARQTAHTKSGTLYWTLIPVISSEEAVAAFEKFEEEIQAAARAGGESTIVLTEVFDFMRPIVLESMGGDAVIKLESAEAITLRVTDAFRHFEIKSSGKVTLELGNITLNGNSIGGGIDLAGGGAFSLIGGGIISCKADNGGGVSVAVSSSLFVSQTKIYNNKAANSGGGIYLADKASLIFEGDVRYNEAKSGGGIFGAYGIEHYTQLPNMTSDILIRGRVEGNQAKSMAGGVYGNIVTMEKGGVVSSNSLIGPSGGAGIKCGTIIMEDGLISDNTFIAPDSIYTVGIGVHCNNGVINGGEISGNIYGSDDGKPSGGGGIYCKPLVDGQTLIINGGKIINNKAYYGGGVFFERSSSAKYEIPPTLQILGGTISNNEAAMGGGIYSNESDAFLKDVEISGNRADKYGGGICANGLTLEIENAVIRANEVLDIDGKQYGGGIYYNYAKSEETSAAHISGSTRIEENKAPNGGGMYIGVSSKYEPGEVYISQDTVVSSNTGTARGGGMFLSNVLANMHGPIKIENNTASNGGGIVANRTKLLLSGAADALTIRGNAAIKGGGIYAYNENTEVTLQDSVLLEGNTAEAEGGGIWTDALENLFVQDDSVQFTKNAARVGYHIQHTADIALHEAQIQTNTVSEPFVYAYNNYDVVYLQGKPVISITVYYHSNGGTGSFSEQAIAEGYTVRALKDTGIARSGYSFTGWNTHADGSGSTYQPAQSMNLQDDMDLYAQWKRNSGGGGNGNGGGSGGGDGEEGGEKPTLTQEHRWYVQGYPNQSFRPQNNISRAEIAMVFYNLIDADDKSAAYSSGFSDVKPGAWYYGAVAYLQAHDILNGYPDGSFAPDSPVTRAELAAVCANFFALQQGRHPFPDVGAGHWANGYIANAYIKGWIEGYPDGTFRPDGRMTRAETVTMLNRILERKLHLENIPNGIRTYSDLNRSHWAYADIIEASHSHDFHYTDDGHEIWEDFEKQ